MSCSTSSDGEVALQRRSSAIEALRIPRGPCRRSARRAAAAAARVASAMASSSWRCSPCERSPAGIAARAARPTRASSAMRRVVQRRLARGVAEEAEARAAARLHGERDILQRGEVAAGRGDLERCARGRAARARASADAVTSCAGEADAAGIRAQRCPEIWSISVVLPAPFGPMSACNSPARDVERDVVGDRQRAEALAQARRAAAAARSRRASAAAPSRRPPRANSTTRISSGPKISRQCSREAGQRFLQQAERPRRRDRRRTAVPTPPRTTMTIRSPGALPGSMAGLTNSVWLASSTPATPAIRRR